MNIFYDKVVERIECAVAPMPKPGMAEEFWLGWQQLQQSLASLHIPLVDANAFDSDVMKATKNLSQNAWVLILGHGQLVVLPQTVKNLAHAFEQNDFMSAVLAYDSSYPGNLSPNYCTLRGLERFMTGLSELPLHLVGYTQQKLPVCTLTRVSAIQDNSVLSNAAWLNRAFVHDYANYQKSSRSELVALVPQHASRVLDVGGGEGNFLAGLKAHWAETTGANLETHLVERSASACDAARDSVDFVWEGDFSKLPLGLKFDCVSFLDVLEHSESPLSWLSQARNLLKPDGVVLASIPNVSHWSVIVDLLEGRWDYSPVGIHCVTHLRFFTEHGLQLLFSEAGFRIIQTQAVQVPCPPEVEELLLKVRGTPLRIAPDPKAWSTYAFLVQASLGNNPSVDA